MPIPRGWEFTSIIFPSSAVGGNFTLSVTPILTGLVPAVPAVMTVITALTASGIQVDNTSGTFNVFIQDSVSGQYVYLNSNTISGSVAAYAGPPATAFTYGGVVVSWTGEIAVQGGAAVLIQTVSGNVSLTIDMQGYFL